ncbi:hypothetical protein E2C06_35200 [Dankookia rubra]|uniref:Uncharacterized protein n=1 Tax=Dankookia rubra TaxID=1442381 RepID=A0A4R5Q674_9PROT|nr:hypothetical protein [Dankookia rubra]TDH57938.1 hypothetical protein E2C06_35200 [Dankookia rubra]
MAQAAFTDMARAAASVVAETSGTAASRSTAAGAREVLRRPAAAAVPASAAIACRSAAIQSAGSQGWWGLSAAAPVSGSGARSRPALP